MYSTLKRRRNGRLHVVSTWNTRGVFVVNKTSGSVYRKENHGSPGFYMHDKTVEGAVIRPNNWVFVGGRPEPPIAQHF